MLLRQVGNPKQFRRVFKISWTPITIGIAIVSVAAVVVVVTIIALKKMKTSLPSRIRSKGIVDIPEKNRKK